MVTESSIIQDGRRRRLSPYDEATVRLKIDARELALRQAVKQAGGLWKSGERVWELRYDQTIALGLEDRIVR